MAMQALKSGSSVPAYIPGCSCNYLRTSSTIYKAAFPTDFIVKAENAYGNIAPINNIANMIGSSILAPSENGNSSPTL